MTDTATYAYPFDPTGTLSSNKIIGERQILSPPNWSDFYFTIPFAAPFFAGTLTAIHHPSGRELVEGVDYALSHRFHDASLACAKPIYGSLTYYDKTLAGTIELTYQTIGGAWTIDTGKIEDILSNAILNPRITTWESITDLPFEFPVIDHQWDLVDLVGMSEVINSLDGIKDAILASGTAGLSDHLADFNNPHRVNATQVGLGNVPNYAVADVPTATAGSNNASLMTPLRVAQAISAQALTPLNTHIADRTNPHGVSAAQVGLGNVPNYGAASQTQATTGTDNATVMTPLRTSQAITTLALGPLSTHVNDHNNPHVVTKAQVGLANVPNFGVADQTAAIAGTASDLLMTPAGVRAAIASQSGGDLSNHISDFTNPHQVSASQVGLGNVQNFGLAQQADAAAGTSNILYMTPLSVKQAITAQVLTAFEDHVNDTSNPHLVTKAQVGLSNVPNYPLASTAEAQAGTSAITLMTPELTAAAIAALADPSGANDSLAAHIADHDNPHDVTAAQVGAYTVLETDSAIAAAVSSKLDATGTAANSSLLEGQTAAQIIASAQSAFDGLQVNYEYPAVLIGEHAGATWTSLGAFLPPDPADPANPTQDFVLDVVGGEGKDRDEAPVYRLTVSTRNPAKSKAVLLSGQGGQISFGYTVDGTDGTVELYLKGVVARNAIALLIVSNPGNAFGASGDVLDLEPSSLNYIGVIERSATAAVVDRGMGEVHYGSAAVDVPGQDFAVLHDTGAPVLFFNVAETTGEQTDCEAAIFNYKDMWHHFEPRNAYGSTQRWAAGSKQWSWDDTNSLIRSPLMGNTALTEFLAPDPLPAVSYTLEVEFGSLDTSDQAIGVCLGTINVDGRDRALYAIRTPGGTVAQSTTDGFPGGGTYGLLTVGYNLFQDDAVILAAVNTGLTWGDGVADADRGSTPYVPQSDTAGTNGWGGKGNVRLRATLTDSSLLIETTDFGSTSYVAAAQVTLDLTGTGPLKGVMAPLATPLQYGGYRWGLCAYNQGAVSFDLLSAPDSFVRYINYDIQPAGDDASTVNYYDGAQWLSDSVQTSHLAKPGRIVYSELTYRQYFVLRNGTLKQLATVAYSPTDHTVLTT